MILHVDQDHARNNDYAKSNGHREETPVLEQEHEQGECAEEQQPALRTVDYPRLLELGHEVLVALGENPDREGLQETPRRWANWWREFLEYHPGTTDTTFHAVSTDQLVCVSGMRIFSLCEHHLLPMWCDVTIGYLPQEKVLGLSKFARIAHQFAHQLQVQERLTQQIADEITRLSGSTNVAVVLNGEHLCMSARGIRTPGLMTSSILRGSFRTDQEMRQTFLSLSHPS